MTLGCLSGMCYNIITSVYCTFFVSYSIFVTTTTWKRERERERERERKTWLLESAALRLRVKRKLWFSVLSYYI
jgi:hypothetical protein